jgi:hypothetical protein
MDFKCYFEQGSYPYIKVRTFKGFARELWSFSNWFAKAGNVEASNVEASNVEAGNVEAGNTEAGNVEASNVEALENL